MKTNPAVSVRSVLAEVKARLSGFSDEPCLDAQVLLAHVMGRPRAWLLAYPDEEVLQPELDALEDGIRRIEDGLPLPYVLGHWEFYGLDFKVTPDVLIPRPETELLAQTALQWLRSHPDRRRAVDLGTGSGCIAITLSVHTRHLLVCAGDISAQALRVAAENAQHQYVLGQVCLFQGSLGGCLSGPVDLVCANLPYIPTQTLKELAVYGREPTLALDGGADGLDYVGAMLADAPRWVAPGGLVLAEIEERQGAAAAALAGQAFPGAKIEILQDLAGKDRLLRVDAWAG